MCRAAVYWLNQVYPETRGDPSTNGIATPGSELGLAVRPSGQCIPLVS